MRRSLLAAAVLALGLLGCAERRRSGSIAFRLSSRHVAPPGSPAEASFGDSALVALGRDSITIRRVELVLKEIQLGDCEPGEEEECAALETGPALVPLPLGSVAELRNTVVAHADTHIVLHFAIYKPEPGRDSTFLAAHPDFAGTSIRVQGTYSRSGRRGDFVYAADFSEEQETALLPPLLVLPDATANLTLRLDLATWFLATDKTALIDPSSANRGQPNASLVHDNIRTSVTAFRDDDHDGLHDHEVSLQPSSSGSHAPAVSPWPAEHDSTRLAALLARNPRDVPPCRQEMPRLTSDSIGPFRLDESLAELQRECPRLLYGWEPDPDGFPVPAVAARLGGVIIKAFLTDTLPTATLRQVDVEHAGPRTAAGVGVGSTLRDLERAYGAPDASEPGCTLRVWFASLPGLAFRMDFPARARRECGGLSEQPLPPDLRVGAVILVPR